MSMPGTERMRSRSSTQDFFSTMMAITRRSTHRHRPASPPWRTGADVAAHADAEPAATARAAHHWCSLPHRVGPRPWRPRPCGCRRTARSGSRRRWRACLVRVLAPGRPTLSTDRAPKQYDTSSSPRYAPFTLTNRQSLADESQIRSSRTQYTHQAMRAIGAGFQSVLFADNPHGRGRQGRGRRGAGREHHGARRARSRPARRRHAPRRRTVRHGGTPAYVDALNDVVIAIMVEKKSCVDDLDRILSVRASTWCSSAPRTSP